MMHDKSHMHVRSLRMALKFGRKWEIGLSIRFWMLDELMSTVIISYILEWSMLYFYLLLFYNRTDKLILPFHM